MHVNAPGAPECKINSGFYFKMPGVFRIKRVRCGSTNHGTSLKSASATPKMDDLQLTLRTIAKIKNRVFLIVFCFSRNIKSECQFLNVVNNLYITAPAIFQNSNECRFIKSSKIIIN
jgi:hypothetical protein